MLNTSVSGRVGGLLGFLCECELDALVLGLAGGGSPGFSRNVGHGDASGLHVGDTCEMRLLSGGSY